MKYSNKYAYHLSQKSNDWGTQVVNGFQSKEEAKKELKKGILKLRELQNTLYASNSYSVLIVFQAMDAGGKDSTIEHVLSGINPQGCQVTSFKHPSSQELEHDFLWRHQLALPERGMIRIFNRSHYENVLISKVHPELVLNERIPGINELNDLDQVFWEERYKKINRFEKNVASTGTLILKFFLNISKEEQRNRFLERLNNPEKHWKFDQSDIEERGYWDDYQKAYRKAIHKTHREDAPWFIIPSDNKWNARKIVADIILEQIEKLNLKMPDITSEKEKQIISARKQLEKE